MTDCQFAHHLGEQIIQVAARGNALQIRCILPLGRRQIESVETRIVEEIALDPPDLVIHLLPLDSRIHFHLNAIRLQRFRGSRWSWWRRGRRGSRSRRHRLGLPGEHLLAVARDLEERHAANRHVGLLGLEVEAVDGQREWNARSKRRRFCGKDDSGLADLQPDVTPRRQRQRQDSLSDVLEIDLCRLLGLLRFIVRLLFVGLLFVRLLILRLLLVRFALFVALRRQGRKLFLGQHREIDAARHWPAEAMDIRLERWA